MYLHRLRVPPASTALLRVVRRRREPRLYGRLVVAQELPSALAVLVAPPVPLDYIVDRGARVVVGCLEEHHADTAPPTHGDCAKGLQGGPCHQQQLRHQQGMGGEACNCDMDLTMATDKELKSTRWLCDGKFLEKQVREDINQLKRA